MSVANKQLDVATNNTESVDRLKRTNPEKAALIKEIWRSPLIPADPIVWRKNLPEDVKIKFNEFFTTYGDKPEELAVLNNLDWGKFKVSSNDQLLPIRQLELFKKRNQVVNDAKLSDADKQAQLQALDADLDKLVARMKELEAKKS